MPSSVNLGPVLEKAITELVESGRYGSRSEVLREGARIIHEREKRLAALDAALARGIADADAGRTHSVDEVRKSLTARYAKMAADKKSGATRKTRAPKVKR
jgi:antitoxin ParD1/3/4